jgi:hypothetical protein
MIMRRSRLLVLMVLVLSAALLQAQRAGGGFRGGARMPGGGGFQTGPRNGFFPGHPGGFHRDRGFGTVWLPWYSPYWDYWDGPFAWDFPVWDYVNFPPSDSTWRGPSYQQSANTTSPQVIVVEKGDPRPPAPPQEPPKLIELPQSKEAPVAKQSPPTLFILKDGGRLESRRYLLTDQSLKIEDGRQQHTIPVSALDLDATIAANHERGIEVTIPRDRNTVFLGF